MIYTESIKRNIDFKRMYYNSKFKIGMLTVIYLKRNNIKKTKLGITVSKKVGNAVVRNRVRRIILAAYRELEKNEDLKGFNIVVVARKNCCFVKMWDVLEEIKKNISFLKRESSKNYYKKFSFKTNWIWRGLFYEKVNFKVIEILQKKHFFSFLWSLQISS